MQRMNELAAYLLQHDHYAVLGHINPDGDACGSCIALALALKALGKQAFVYLPGGMPKMFRPFPLSLEIASGKELPFEPESAFAVDMSDMGRMGEGLAVYEACKYHAMLDHHATNRGFGDVWLVDGEAAACGELALELIHALGVELNGEMAMWLYIAILTDCGRFGYSNTRVETMEAATACLRCGIDVANINRLIYQTRSEGRTRLLAAVISHMRLNKDKTICWSAIDDEVYRQAGAIREDLDGAVNYLLDVEGVEIACLADQRGENFTKFSLRSKEFVDVGADIAAPFGGGGHNRAAGISMDLPLEQALAKVLETAEQALNKAKK